MLVNVVEELEHEATERVQILEEKLQRSAQCICEVCMKLSYYVVQVCLWWFNFSIVQVKKNILKVY